MATNCAHHGHEKKAAMTSHRSFLANLREQQRVLSTSDEMSQDIGRMAGLFWCPCPMASSGRMQVAEDGKEIYIPPPSMSALLCAVGRKKPTLTPNTA